MKADPSSFLGVYVEVPPSTSEAETVTLRGPQENMGEALTLVYGKVSQLNWSEPKQAPTLFMILSICTVVYISGDSINLRNRGALTLRLPLVMYCVEQAINVLMLLMMNLKDQ